MTQSLSVACYLAIIAITACGNSTAPATSSKGGSVGTGNGNGRCGWHDIDQSDASSGGPSDAGYAADAGPSIIFNGSTQCDASALPFELHLAFHRRADKHGLGLNAQLGGRQRPDDRRLQRPLARLRHKCGHDGKWSMVYLNFTIFEQASSASQ